MGHGGMHSGVSGCVKLGSGRGCVGGLGRGGGGGHGGVRLCSIWYGGVWGCLMGGWVCVWAWGGKMGGVGREGVSVGGDVSGGWYRVLTLVLAGFVWVWVRLGVVAHFRLVPGGSLGVGGACVGGYAGCGRLVVIHGDII
jgi:hypothetical protein